MNQLTQVNNALVEPPVITIAIPEHRRRSMGYGQASLIEYLQGIENALEYMSSAQRLRKIDEVSDIGARLMTALNNAKNLDKDAFERLGSVFIKEFNIDKGLISSLPILIRDERRLPVAVILIDLSKMGCGQLRYCARFVTGQGIVHETKEQSRAT